MHSHPSLTKLLEGHTLSRSNGDDGVPSSSASSSLSSFFSYKY
ncbi:MAG: hypothetical protein ACREOZ_04295 [Gloeomargaritales cyanobacterium]